MTFKSDTEFTEWTLEQLEKERDILWDWLSGKTVEGCEKVSRLIEIERELTSRETG